MPDTNSNALLSPPRRPRVQRQRSSSLPFIQAIEVTATEAAIMFAAEQAATSRRRVRSPDRQQQRRQRRPQSADLAWAADLARNVPSSQDEAGDKDNGPSEDLQQQPSAQPRSNPPPPPASHPPDVDPAALKPRQPSITGLVSEELHALLPLPQNPLNTYSANLARFIQSRINSIRSAIPAPPLSPSSPCSCPELSQFYPFSDLHSPTDPDGPQSPSGPSGLLNPNPFEAIDPLIPTKPTDSIDPPNFANPSALRVERNLSIALPPLPFPFRPPLRSTFSNWSSTSGCNSPAAWADEPLPSPPVLNGDSIASTPSILELYASATSRSGFAGTPLDDPVAEEGVGAAGAGAGSAPAPTSAPPSALASPSAPALASVSVSPSPAAAATPDQPAEPSFLRPSYFSPRHCPQQVLAAISPYEGGALTRVVDVFIQAPNRVVVEGMAFEMVG